jgi:hypothetical protein
MLAGRKLERSRPIRMRRAPALQLASQVTPRVSRARQRPVSGAIGNTERRTAVPTWSGSPDRLVARKRDVSGR